jgi:threonyl-tRNA synthetase
LNKNYATKISVPPQICATKKIGANIREATLDLVPYLAVVGAKESESNTLALRSRKEGKLGVIAVETVIEKLLEEIKTRNLCNISVEFVF